MAEKETEATVPLVMTVREICVYLKIHPATLYRLVRTGKIPHFRMGAGYRFSRDAIERWMKKSEIT